MFLQNLGLLLGTSSRWDPATPLKHPGGEQQPKGFARAWEDPEAALAGMSQCHSHSSQQTSQTARLVLSYSEGIYLFFSSIFLCFVMFKSCCVPPAINSHMHIGAAPPSSLLPRWKSDQISHGVMLPPWTEKSPTGVQTTRPRLLALGKPPQPFPLDAHAYTGGERRSHCCPSATGDTQTLCPEDKER